MQVGSMEQFCHRLPMPLFYCWFCSWRFWLIYRTLRADSKAFKNYSSVDFRLVKILVFRCFFAHLMCFFRPSCAIKLSNVRKFCAKSLWVINRWIASWQFRHTHMPCWRSRSENWLLTQRFLWRVLGIKWWNVSANSRKHRQHSSGNGCLIFGLDRALDVRFL